MFEWLEETTVATMIGQSVVLTGLMSAIHLIGLTLIVGGSLVIWLRLLGVLLAEHSISSIAVTVNRGAIFGLAISLTTGLLLFAPSATAAYANSTFQIKMMLLLSALLFHSTIFRRVVRCEEPIGLSLRLMGSIGPMLWFAVAVAGAWFILFE